MLEPHSTVQDQLKNNSALSVFRPPVVASFERRPGWRHSFIAGTVAPPAT
jgi:hypothetical protein